MVFQLNGNTTGAQFLDHRIQTPFIDGTDGVSRYLQGNPFILLGQEKTFHLQIRVEPALGLNVRVANMMTGHGFFSCYLTYSCHDL